MGKFKLLQAVYAVTGILFFVRDLMVEKVPMGKAMVNAFIWPYAQWPMMKAQAVQWADKAVASMQ
jgi:hypothetical protein